MFQHHQWTFKRCSLVKQTIVQGQSTERPLPKGIAARIIHERRWCVLIQPVRRGATAWIVGIATG
jgi:hypothetical protein